MLHSPSLLLRRVVVKGCTYPGEKRVETEQTQTQCQHLHKEATTFLKLLFIAIKVILLYLTNLLSHQITSNSESQTNKCLNQET